VLRPAGDRADGRGFGPAVLKTLASGSRPGASHFRRRYGKGIRLGTAIAGTAQFVIGMGFHELGKYWSRRIKGNTTRALLSWPCYGLAFVFISSAAFTIFWNMFGPVVLWVFSWFQR
jgi:hypothetical protein